MRFTRPRATTYLGSFAVWLGGFVAGWVIGAVAWLVSDTASPTRLARFAVCWVALVVGAGVPAALRTLRSSP